MINPDKILFIPSLRQGNGTGHLKRCLDWASGFKEVHIYLLDCETEKSIDMQNHPIFKTVGNLIYHDAVTDSEGDHWELIILDNRLTSDLPIQFKGVPVLAIDEAGDLRKSASYILDILPSSLKELPNLQEFSFFNGPKSIRPDRKLKKILISFGGEDPCNLSTKILQSLDMKLLSRFDWYVILPEKNKSVNSTPLEVHCLDYADNLKDQLMHYDFVITSYGLTAVESLCSRVPVLLFNPGKYHDKLSRLSKIPYCPKAYKKVNSQINHVLSEALMTQMTNNQTPWVKLWEKYTQKSAPFMEWIQSMTISAEDCPICGSSHRKSIGRFPQRSYFLCRDCSMKYMVQFRQKKDIYKKDYFFSDYKAQYGKTYLEDFPHIRKMASERLGRIRIKSGSLLDIGCAYGPFLLEAIQKGFSSWGLEISEDAVSYVREHYPEIRIHQDAFENIPSKNPIFDKEQFDVITLWYVIEHFDDLSSLLTKVNYFLKKGGILALSTPHASGISGIFNLSGFLENSPEDHFTLWDRRSARKAFFGWGDTFEIYAVKG
jgi:2-polyprenyl-3-methyl-5-hydroxy-6-metoxy-1,4-benzoquinol methylase/spore coat polysaccharide biosynthesis predicted glycosyltransferase SpsG